MSKIYEALLRAELERTVTTGEESPGLVATDGTDSLLHPDPTFLATELLDHQPLPFLDTPIDLAAPVAPDDFGSATRYPWSPVAASLPALDDRGPHVEQFRSLRSHLMELRDAGPLKSVVVSSGLPGEGKSFIALNLALSFSRHKANRVLLIDGDLRRSSLHKVLGSSREPGLSDYLAGERELFEVIQRCDPAGRAIHPGLAALTFISGGRDVDNAGDLAAHPRFAQMMATAGEYFDWIFIDSSPVNLVSDAVSLARASDGVLLIAREGQTKFKTAQQAQAQFKSVRVLGCVLNAVQKLPVTGDYYGAYDTYRNEG